MTVFTLARAILELISDPFCEVNNVYFKDADGNFYPIQGCIVDEDNDLILTEEEY